MTPAEADDVATRREGGSGRPRERSADGKLARGSLIRRYVVLDVIGEGGMGVVYGAFDPELDRKIAIKLLQAGDGESTGQAWLLREAQALARLSHPNVVAVHDVGTVDNDRVFVAMELVAGQTLRQWLKEPRTWREVVAVMLAAGTGLAAAHAKGLVHRDFKPDNVIVGDDGRVRVMDFGLARLRGGEEPETHHSGTDLRIDSKSPLSEPLTVAGTLVGTPAYMAPELHRGDSADARADQFAFGVALYEALFAARPYSREELKTGAAKPPEPSSADVPARLRTVVLRAISLAPSARYPSMDALLAELAIDPLRRRKQLALGGGAVLAVGGAVAATLLLQGSRTVETPPELCTGAAKRLGGVWDAQERSKLEKAFLDTKLDTAKPAFTAIAKALDTYATGWSTAAADNCEATRLRGEQTEDVMTLRQGCLDQRLEELRALVRVLGDSPNRAVIEKGDRSVAELEPLARCNNIAALREPGLPPPEIAPKLLEITRLLAEAKADIIVGRYVPALSLGRQATEGAAKIHWAPIRAETEAMRGTSLMVLGNYDEAAKAYMDATWAAFEGKRDDMIAGAAMSVATVAASGLGKPAEGRIWLALAEAALARAGTDPQRELRITQVRGIVLSESGDLLAATKAHADSYRLACSLYGKDNPTMFADEGMYATTLTKAFQFKTAVEHLDHAIALRVQTVGSNHPDVAMLLSNEGIALRRVPDEKRAQEAFARALAIREKSYGMSSPLLVPTLDNWAELLNQQGRYVEALAKIDRALALAEVIPGKQHPMWHQVATSKGEILTNAGKHAQARAVFDEVFALEHASKSAVLPITESARAQLAIAEKAWADAERFATSSIEHFEGLGGKTNPELVFPLISLGRAKLELHDQAGAKTALARADAIAKQTQLSERELAPLRAAQARL